MTKMLDLKPFAADTSPLYTLQASATRQADAMLLEYILQGPIEDLIIPPSNPRPALRDELWKTTCFEIFLQQEGHESYTEWNFSPSGDWACYQFSGYRQRLPSASLPAPGNWEFALAKHLLSIKTLIPLDAPPAQRLRMSLTAILHHKDQTKSYWALEHRGQQPDFHLAASFVHRL